MLFVGAVVIVQVAATVSARAAAGDEIPSAEQLAKLLVDEPISKGSWPEWRRRLLGWLGDKQNRTDAAFDAASRFLYAESVDKTTLPEPLSDDYFANYLLASYWLHFADVEQDNSERGKLAEKSLRRTLQLQPDFARAHRNLALALLLQNDPANLQARQAEAEAELNEAAKLDRDLDLHWFRGQLCLEKRDFAAAEQHFRLAVQEDPDSVGMTYSLAQSVLAQPNYAGSRSKVIKPLVDRFPNDAVLITFHAAALAFDDHVREGARELEHARSLGGEPEKILSVDLVRQIEQAAAPTWVEKFGYVMGGFAVVYLIVIAAMALVGWILARYTSGLGALRLLGDTNQTGMAVGGKVLRTTGESRLARCYAMSIMAGLVLFYVAIPFIVVGVLAGTVGGLWLILQLPRIPIKLLVIVVFIGGGMAWTILKSLFAKSSGDFGIAKTRADCPRLFACLQEVAAGVNTRPVDQVFLAPGAGIGVYQSGRGPFGLFGVKNRVLSLGLAGMRYLSQNELRAILAHEYAHFSHSDTFYGRFIYQVKHSMEQALMGMGASGGKLNYINPFYWLLYFYYRAYSLLTAGFSRSREFLADRMAASLYGGDTFISALRKVSSEAMLLESTIYENASKLLDDGRSFDNMYARYHAEREIQSPEELGAELAKLHGQEKDSLFNSHPTNVQRFEALDTMPPGKPDNSQPAIELLDQPDAVEKELTDFLADYLRYIAAIHAQAAAAS